MKFSGGRCELVRSSGKEREGREGEKEKERRGEKKKVNLINKQHRRAIKKEALLNSQAIHQLLLLLINCWDG